VTLQRFEMYSTYWKFTNILLFFEDSIW